MVLHTFLGFEVVSVIATAFVGQAILCFNCEVGVRGLEGCLKVKTKEGMGFLGYISAEAADSFSGESSDHLQSFDRRKIQGLTVSSSLQAA